MTDDLQYQIRRDMRNPQIRIDDDELQNLGLVELELILNKKWSLFARFSTDAIAVL